MPNVKIPAVWSLLLMTGKLIYLIYMRATTMKNLASIGQTLTYNKLQQFAPVAPDARTSRRCAKRYMLIAFKPAKSPS
jgi:hypothetical protein